MKLAPIKKDLLRQLAALRAEHPRITTRTLDADDVERILGDIKDALKQRRPDDAKLTVKAVGGFVPNSYGYPGESDRADVEIDLATGAATATLRRARAESRPFGRGSCRVVRLARAGTIGRVIG